MVWTLTLASLVAYIIGLILLMRIAPALIKRSFDETFFIAVAAVAVLGAMLVFAAVGVTYTVFSGSLTVRGLDAFLLLILFIVTIRVSFSTFRPRYGIGIGTDRVSRVLTGSFFLLVAIAALCVLVLLFSPA
jgi:hypothetical protein